MDDCEPAEAPDDFFSFFTPESGGGIAFLQWLVSRADPSYRTSHPVLNEVATRFLFWLLRQSDFFPPDAIQRVETRRRWCTTFHLIDGSHLLAFSHGDWLSHRYLTRILDFSERRLLHPVLLSLPREPENTFPSHERRLLTFPRLLRIIDEQAAAAHPLVAEFRRHMERTVARYESYLTLPPSRWLPDSWEGFFAFLDRSMIENACREDSSPGLPGSYRCEDIYLDDEGLRLIGLAQDKPTHDALRRRWRTLAPGHPDLVEQASDPAGPSFVLRLSRDYRVVHPSGFLDPFATFDALTEIMRRTREILLPALIGKKAGKSAALSEQADPASLVRWLLRFRRRPESPRLCKLADKLLRLFLAQSGASLPAPEDGDPVVIVIASPPFPANAPPLAGPACDSFPVRLRVIPRNLLLPPVTCSLPFARIRELILRIDPLPEFHREMLRSLQYRSATTISPYCDKLLLSAIRFLGLVLPGRDGRAVSVDLLERWIGKKGILFNKGILPRLKKILENEWPMPGGNEDR